MRPDEPIGPQLTALLDRSKQRIEERIAQLEAVRERIRGYRARHPAALAGRPDVDLFGPGSSRPTPS